MTAQIMVHDCITGESYLRDMTEEEIAQAEIDLQIPKQWQNYVSEEESVADEPVEGEQP